ncbi:hypothetical protein CW713_08750 [Methanophagales archaeon]|nr:MAG: hypothetical protein CW713_08750 [Methanophagales archaeon]
MVLPLIPLAVGGLIGGGGAALGSMFGGGKKTEIEKHAMYEHYAPQTTTVYSPSYAPQTQFAPVTSYAYQGATYIISSPGAESKKEQKQSQKSIPSQKGEWAFPIEVSQEAKRAEERTEGTDFAKIAIIGVIGLVAYGVISKRK